MLHIRVVKTASGSRAIQVVYYRNRKRIVFKHIGSGKTEEEIIDYFAVTYGERAAGDPRNKLEAYLVPVALILLGVGILVTALRMWRKPLGAVAASPKEARVGDRREGRNDAKPVRQDEYIARLEEELKKRK